MVIPGRKKEMRPWGENDHVHDGIRPEKNFCFPWEPKASLSPALSQSILMLLKFLRHRDGHRVSAVKKPLKPSKNLHFFLSFWETFRNSWDKLYGPCLIFSYSFNLRHFSNLTWLQKCKSFGPQRVWHQFPGDRSRTFLVLPVPWQKKKTVENTTYSTTLNCKVRLAAPGSCCASLFARGSVSLPAKLSFR